MTSQTDAILWHLQHHGRITPMDALNLYGSMRLAARINDLRRAGHAIRTDTEERNGRRWAAYSLEPRQVELF